ncbi:MAG: hypothetical protein QF756_08705 [Dehalococcoidia bacterium]|jgi:hypothetical protein|nr:hypothetical protein [Dehalococcoidia bacterium]
MSQGATIQRLQHDDADAVRELDRQILGPDRSPTGDQYVEQLCGEAREEGIEELYSVLRAEDERDQAFLRSAVFDDAGIKAFVRKP